MKKIIGFIIFLIVVNSSFSQSDSTVVYLDKNFYKTEKDSAQYTLVIEPIQEDNTFRVKIFYLSGELASSGISTSAKSVLYQGPYISYYKNGQTKTKGSYKEKTKIGEWKSWYQNGQLKSVDNYLDFENKKLDPMLKHQLLEYYDSTGNQIITEGAGLYVEHFENSQQVRESGNYKKGYKAGEWKGYRIDGSNFYTENYTKGVIKNGISWDDEGKQYSYTQLEEPAVPMDGREKFYQRIGQNLRYPEEARRKGIEGRVFIQFVVNKEGKLTEIAVIKSPHHSLSIESERILRLEKDWIPGKQKGQNVNQRIILPITFKLQ